MQSLAVAILVKRTLRATLKMFRRCLGPKHDLKRLPWYCSRRALLAQTGVYGASVSNGLVVNGATSLNGAATYGIWHNESERRRQSR